MGDTVALHPRVLSRCDAPSNVQSSNTAGTSCGASRGLAQVAGSGAP